GVRIIPIYFVGLALGYLVPERPISPHEFLYDALFLQTWAAKTPPGNSALWSLHFEVVFYLLFPILWALRLRPLPVAVGSGLLGLCSLFFPTHIFYIAAYFPLWLVGLHLSRTELPKNDLQRSVRQLMPALALQIAFLSGSIWAALVAKVAPPMYGLETIPH